MNPGTQAESETAIDSGSQAESQVAMDPGTQAESETAIERICALYLKMLSELRNYQLYHLMQ